ncbi:hypothetical protein NMY22_g14846 [Coprinellus aureogranulatus]|nr:hypothetical protein NMY22_g14846 [Coprinellus aureogranulatus]
MPAQTEHDERGSRQNDGGGKTESMEGKGNERENGHGNKAKEEKGPLTVAEGRSAMLRLNRLLKEASKLTSESNLVLARHNLVRESVIVFEAFTLYGEEQFPSIARVDEWLGILIQERREYISDTTAKLDLSIFQNPVLNTVGDEESEDEMEQPTENQAEGGPMGLEIAGNMNEGSKQGEGEEDDEADGEGEIEQEGDIKGEGTGGHPRSTRGRG